MLHAHPEIEFLPETQFLRTYIFKNRKETLQDETQKRNFINVLNHDEKFQRARVAPEQIVANAKTYTDAYFNLLQSVRNQHTRFSGDKDPRFLDFLPDLYRVVPDAKVVHIIRDPREVVLSRTKADWSSHWPFFMHPVMYNAQLERGRKLGMKLFKENYLEIYYEDLVAAPREVLTGISDFLQIDFSEKMLAFGESAKKLVDEKEMQWKKETLGPLLTDNTQKWKCDLTNEQIYIIQRICSDAFLKHPYKRQKVSVSVPIKIKTSLLTIFASIFKILYPLRLKFLK